MIHAAIAIYNRTIGFFSLPRLSGAGSFHFFLLPFYFLFLISCEKQTTPVTLPNPRLTLTIEDVAVTEAWLRLGAQETAAEQQIIVRRDSSEIYTLSGAITDTTLHDSALLPAHDYTYRAELRKNGQKIVGTEPVSITTIDTTSHDFQWEIFEFGGARGSSVLYDVAIVNENDIWAVGEIHTAETDTFDSLGNWVPPYNAVHWDGSEWELKRITYNGSFWTIKSVFAFSSNDVWFAAFVNWNGMNYVELPIPNILIGHGINKIWGTSGNDLYVVGTQGLIAHYTDQSWQRIYTGMNVNFYDIWGAANSQSGQTEIFILGSLPSIGQERAILHVDHNGRFSEVDVSGLPFSLKSVWFVPDKSIFVAGDGLFHKRNLDEPLWKNINQGHPNFYRESVRGNGLNDIFVGGHFGLFSHFNGVSWHHYNATQLPQFYGLYTSLAVKEDHVVAVGVFNAGLGIIVRGIRNP